MTVTGELRTPGHRYSRLAGLRPRRVRSGLIGSQRARCVATRVVMAGRDIGTVIFPTHW